MINDIINQIASQAMHKIKQKIIDLNVKELTNFVSLNEIGAVIYPAIKPLINDPQIRADIATSPRHSYDFITKYLKERWPEGEQAILQSPEFTFLYIINFLKERWPQGEQVILQDPRFTMEYIYDFLKQPWPEGEPTILKNASYTLGYITKILQKPWPEGEKALIQAEVLRGRTRPALIYDYITQIKKERWPEGEKVILQDSPNTLRYLQYLHEQGQRWPEGEQTILKDPYSTYLYITTILKERWPEGEQTILQSPEWAYKYVANFLKKPWPEAEPIIATDIQYSTLYDFYLKRQQRSTFKDPYSEKRGPIKYYQFHQNSWSAYRNSYDGAPDAHPIDRLIGKGATKQEAAQDLIDQEHELFFHLE